MPVYLRPAGVARTQFKSSGFTQKRVDGLFKKGYQDGVFNGWPGEWSLPAAPAVLCYYEALQDQEYALLAYTVGFYMGSVDSTPGPGVPDPCDAGIHGRICQVRCFLLFEGGADG